MPSKLVKFRRSAYVTQACKCFYCAAPMWERNLADFAQKQNLSISHARFFKSTAEHLHAKVDGGNNIRENIAAACLRCNQLRHRRKKSLSPSQYKSLVQKRANQGRWHPVFPRKPYIEIIVP